MPGILTAVIGGIQGANASHDAAGALSGAYNDAGGLLKTATGQAVTAGQAGIDQANTAIDSGLNNANSTLADVFKTETGNLQPYQAAGSGAISTLSGELAPGGDLSKQFNPDMMAEDPGYNFRLQQGQQALERSKAATGSALGGGALKEAARYGQDYASNEYGKAFDRFMQQKGQRYGMLSNLAGFGQTANSQGIVAGNNYGDLTSGNFTGAGREKAGAAMQGNQYIGDIGLKGAALQGEAKVGAGKAIAAGDIGAANAWNGMLSGIGQAGDAALAGGFGGGGGFSPIGAVTGVPQGVGGDFNFPMSPVSTSPGAIPPNPADPYASWLGGI